jgi:hypothetical protein
MAAVHDTGADRRPPRSVIGSRTRCPCRFGMVDACADIKAAKRTTSGWLPIATVAPSVLDGTLTARSED